MHNWQSAHCLSPSTGAESSAVNLAVDKAFHDTVTSIIPFMRKGTTFEMPYVTGLGGDDQAPRKLYDGKYCLVPRYVEISREFLLAVIKL